MNLADELESAVLTVAEQVATAATEMGASANGLAEFARDAVGQAETGLGTVMSLRTPPRISSESASRMIGGALTR